VEKQEKVHILFLGLDHRLLWQLTRTLVLLEDRIILDSVKTPSEAKEICDREEVHVIVVDGWEKAWKAARHLSGDEAFEGGAWKWIIVADSIPLECLPAGRVSPSALLLEKPFNPKKFPSFLLEVVERGEPAEEEKAPEPDLVTVSLPVAPGESYREPEVGPDVEPGPLERPLEDEVRTEAEPGESTAEPEVAAEPVGEPVEPEPDAFYGHVDQGFACLSEKDWKGAEEHWSEALKLRPGDERLQANLRRLRKKLEQNG
jgi:hypothetical protein